MIQDHNPALFGESGSSISLHGMGDDPCLCLVKGIAHFMSGVTVASFCPWAIEAAQDGNPAYFLLGAVAGILPDTIDFKFYRYFYPYDVYVEPCEVIQGQADRGVVNPQPIAEAMAAAIASAAEGTSTTLKLSTLQIGADLWRQYRVQIDPSEGAVSVQVGPVVSTGQVPQSGTLPKVPAEGIATFLAPIFPNEKKTYTVDIFDGPSFTFEKNEAGRVKIHFLPWHRSWSHSLVVGALLGGGVSLWTWRAGVVVFGAYLIHALEDQMGHMGTNLFFPFTKKRVPGLQWMHSGDALPNFFVVWFCGLLIFWNLYAAIDRPLYHFSFLRFMIAALVIPFSVAGLLRWFLVHAD